MNISTIKNSLFLFPRFFRFSIKRHTKSIFQQNFICRNSFAECCFCEWQKERFKVLFSVCIVWSGVEIFLLLFIKRIRKKLKLHKRHFERQRVESSFVHYSTSEGDKVHFNKWFRIYTFCSPRRRISFAPFLVTEHAITFPYFIKLMNCVD